jgi:hypothetical protein
MVIDISLCVTQNGTNARDQVFEIRLSFEQLYGSSRAEPITFARQLVAPQCPLGADPSVLLHAM